MRQILKLSDILLEQDNYERIAQYRQMIRELERTNEHYRLNKRLIHRNEGAKLSDSALRMRKEINRRITENKKKMEQYREKIRQLRRK